MDALVVTDGTWTKYQSEQFISYEIRSKYIMFIFLVFFHIYCFIFKRIISETFDVSMHGSTMALLHGNTGEWASKPTKSLITLFDNVANYTNSCTSNQ